MKKAGVVVGVLLGGLVGAFLLTSQVTRSAWAPSPQVVAGSLDDLLMDLQLLPLEGQAPKPFALEGLDGRRMALADLAGRPALLYFWATW